MNKEKPDILIYNESRVDKIHLIDWDFENRNIYIEGYLDGAYADAIQRQIAFLVDDAKKPEKEGITLFIQGLGGELRAGLNLYSSLIHCDCPVRTIATGTCASMMAVLMLAGEKRLMMPYSKLVFHEPVLDSDNRKTYTELCEIVKSMKRYTDILTEIISNRCGQPVNKIKRLMSGKDLVLEAEDALAFGAVSGIIEKL